MPTHTTSLAGLDNYNLANRAAFTDLIPGGNYNLWVFSLHDGSDGGTQFDATVTGGGTPQVMSFDMTGTPGDLWINGAVGSSASPLSSYASLMKASDTGRIDIDFTGTGGSGETSLAGLALQLTGDARDRE